MKKQQPPPAVKNELEGDSEEESRSISFSPFFANDNNPPTDNWQNEQRQVVHDNIRTLATTAAAAAVASSNQYQPHTSMKCYNDWERNKQALHSIRSKNTFQKTGEAYVPTIGHESAYILPSWSPTAAPKVKL
jgi:hypothetical protein